MKKIDYKKELKELYGPKAGKPAEVELPAMNFLMVDGRGDPNAGDQFGPAVEALYALSYALKFMIKKGEQQLDYGVMPLEGLWWADDMSKFSVDDKASWKRRETDRQTPRNLPQRYPEGGAGEVEDRHPATVCLTPRTGHNDTNTYSRKDGAP